MSLPIVEAKDVSKSFGEGHAKVQALNSVNLSLDAGNLTLLMGPSGSGKTTLLSILGCMLTPSRGSVSICGNRTEKGGAEKLAQLRRKFIGFVFQSYHLFPTLTAAENVQLALDVRGEHGRKARQKSKELLAKLGLENRAHALPRELSGGEQQRVAIARAIVAGPAVVFADEPTAALDGDNGRAIMGILAGIAKEKARAVLVVTHDTRLLTFADRVLFIEDGFLKDEKPADASVLPLRRGSRVSS
jgi:putative ABC transport system ATP-binding protein